jgi:hypothetical protein
MKPDLVLHPLPRARAIVAEQLRSVGIALRREWLLYFLGLGFFTLMFALNELREGRNPNLRSAFGLTAEVFLPLAILGLFAPMSVWKSEGPGRRSYHWAMPVGRARHTLLKCLAGWGWLMLLVAVFIAWGAAMAWVTGGPIGVWMDHGVDPGRTGGLQMLRTLPRGMAAWQWVVPFTAITTTYLVGSVIALASDYPWVWLGGIFVGLLILNATLTAAGLDEATRSLNALVNGHYGLMTAISGMRQAVSEVVIRGEMLRVRSGAPDLSAWLLSTLIWMGAAAGGVLWAANRHPED